MEAGVKLKVRELEEERDRVEGERLEKVRELEEVKRKISGYYQPN